MLHLASRPRCRGLSTAFCLPWISRQHAAARAGAKSRLAADLGGHMPLRRTCVLGLAQGLQLVQAAPALLRTLHTARPARKAQQQEQAGHRCRWRAWTTASCSLQDGHTHTPRSWVPAQCMAPRFPALWALASVGEAARLILTRTQTTSGCAPAWFVLAQRAECWLACRSGSVPHIQDKAPEAGQAAVPAQCVVAQHALSAGRHAGLAAHLKSTPSHSTPSCMPAQRAECRLACRSGSAPTFRPASAPSGASLCAECASHATSSSAPLPDAAQLLRQWRLGALLHWPGLLAPKVCSSAWPCKLAHEVLLLRTGGGHQSRAD